ncbi:MAG TPA: type II secretion system protein GspN [Polyangia bacterium]
MTPERRAALIRIAALSAFALVVFVVSFILAFPYDRIKDQVIARGAAQGYDVRVESAGPVFGVGVAMDNITVRSRPTPGTKASVFEIDSARVHVSPLAQLLGTLAFDVALETMGGQIDADVAIEKKRAVNKVTARDLAMSDMPGVRQAINLPLAGTLNLDLDLVSPNQRNAEANGSLNWKWAGMVLGDGKEKLKIAGNPLMAEGISLPRVRFGDFGGRVVFQKGVGKLQGVGARSQDAEVKIEGEVRLADPPTSTYLDLYITFKFSDALLKSADKLQLMLQFAESAGKRSDGFFGFRISGTPARMSPVLWQKTSPFAGSGSGRASLDGAMGSSMGQVALDRPRRRDTLVASPTAAADVGAPNTPPAPPPAAEAPPAPPSEDPNDGARVKPTANLPRYVTEPPRQ